MIVFFADAIAFARLYKKFAQKGFFQVLLWPGKILIFVIWLIGEKVSRPCTSSLLLTYVFESMKRVGLGISLTNTLIQS